MDRRHVAGQSLVLDRRSVLSLLAASVTGCVPPGNRLRSGRVSERPQVVLLAIDGVRWQDVFFGADPDRVPRGERVGRRELVPHLMKMEKHGAVLGAPEMGGFHASGPNFVSLPGYMEMLSGTAKTGCYNNGCRRMNRPSLLDDYAEESHPHPTPAAAFSSWPKVEFAASTGRRGIVSAGRHGGFNLGALRRYPKTQRIFRAASNSTGMAGAADDFRSDAWTGGVAYTFLKEANPDFVFVSLGETDEWGHQNDYPQYLRALSSADRFVGRVRRYLNRSARETALFVTTDHGRASGFRDHGSDHPESSRSFLFAEGTMIRAAGPISPVSETYLRDIAPTVRAIAGLRQREGSDQGRALVELMRAEAIDGPV